MLTFLAYLRGRIDELSRQLNNANDELRDLCTTFRQVTLYNELLVRENAELKRKLKGKGRARNDDEESENEDTGDSRQTKRQRCVTHSSAEEDEEVEDERARVNSY